MADQKPNGLFITDDAGNVYYLRPEILAQAKMPDEDVKRLKDELAASGKGKETLLETLTESKNILEQLIADLGPCDHSKKICVCVETEVLAKVNNQIAKLAEKKGRHTLAKTV